MDVSIFGLGYVGCVAGGCFAEHDHSVVGVDINPRKVEMVNNGVCPVDEPGLNERFASGSVDGTLSATTDAHEAITGTDISIVSVGTPLDSSGQLSTTNLYNVIDSTVEPLQETEGHTFVIRSTVPPNTTRKLQSYLHEKLSDPTSIDFVVNPEFIREGSAVEDFYDPPYVILGKFEDGDAEPVKTLYQSLEFGADIHVVDPELAESLKFVSNTFHALKVTFANEVSSVASNYDINGKQLMEFVRADQKLNISPSYLKPGMSFGGSCLPKDNQAFGNLAGDAGIDIPLINNIQRSNAAHLDRIADRVDALAADRVGIVGVSFKSDTTDMRNSPALELMLELETDVCLYGTGVNLSELVGSNRDYIDRVAPDIESRLWTDPEGFLDTADTIVFTNNGSYPELRTGIEDHIVCDPIGAVCASAEQFAEYHPLIW